MPNTELDYMEYANDGLAQAAYVVSGQYGPDVLTGGAATADTEEGANVAARGADDNEATWWTSTDTAYPHWWKYDLGAAVTKIVTKLRLYPNMINVGVGIKNFTLQGSNNDADWDTLLTDITTNDEEWQDFTFANTTAYRYYMVNVTDDWDAGFDFCSIKEIEMLETVLQCYSESTIITQGTYSLKGLAQKTNSLNDTLTRTCDPTIDLSDLPTVYFDIKQSNIAGSIKVGIHDSGGTTTEKTVTVAGHAITFAGTAQLDTAAKKWGTASLLLDGNSDYLSIPDSADWDIVGSSTDNWTIDFQVKFTDHAGTEILFMQAESNNDCWFIQHIHDSGMEFVAYKAGSLLLATGLAGEVTDTNWHHIAVCKVGSNYGMYLDGTQVNHTDDSDTDTFTASLLIGEYYTGALYFDGQMDEIRIQHSNVFGAAPVVGLSDTITPPTGAHTADANTKLLLHLDGADEAVATLDSSRDYWQTIAWDISGVSNANKDVIDSIIITILNADNDNTFYIDNMYGLAVANFMLGCNF